MHDHAPKGLLIVTILASGCGKGKPDHASWLKDHEADYAALDATVSRVTSAIKDVPDRATSRFPRCKPSPAYVYDSNHKELATVGFLLDGLGASTSPVSLALDAREPGNETSAALARSTPDLFDSIRKLDHFVVLRRHAGNENSLRVTGDVFVIEASTAKVVCAFGFVGPEKQSASATEVTGTTTWVNVRTGKVVRTERTTKGGGGGTSADLEATNALPEVLGRNLGIAIYSSENLAVKKGLGYDGTSRIADVLSDRNVVAPSPTGSRTDRGVRSQWTVGGLDLHLYDFAQAERVALGAAQAVDAGDDPEGRELASQLVKTPASSADEIVARATPLGWRPGRGAALAQPDKRLAEHTISLEKGKVQRTLWILDFHDAGARVDGRRVLFGTGTDPVAGSAAAIVAEVFDGIP